MVVGVGAALNAEYLVNAFSSVDALLANGGPSGSPASGASIERVVCVGPGGVVVVS